MAIGSIIDVQITAGTVQPSRQAFGVPLIVTQEAGAVIGYSAASAGSYVEVSSVREAIDLGFPSGGATHRLVAAVFRSKPRPPKVMIGALRSGAAVAQEVTLTPSVLAAGEVFTIAITDKNGTTESITATADATPTADEIADALRTSAGSLTIALSADAGPGSPLVVTADVAGEMFGFKITSTGASPLSLVITETTATDSGYDDALGDILATSEGAFYGVLIDSQAVADLDVVAAWAAANGKLFGAWNGDVSGSFTSDATAKAASNDNAFFLRTQGTKVNADTFDFPAATWMGDMFSRDAGSATWAFKTLEGVPAETLGTTYKSSVETAGANWYGLVKGVGITFPGKTAGGEYIDVVRGIDWLVARMEERLFAALVNNPKIPYTDAGISIVKAEIDAQLKEAYVRGFIDDGWTVTVPAKADTSAADRAARTLNGVEFEATLQGAIHAITVRGTVSV